MTKKQMTSEFEGLIRNELLPLTQRVVAALRPLTNRDFGPEAFAIHFEAPSTELGDSFPVAWFVFDNERNEIDEVLEYTLQIDPAITCTIPDSLLDSEDYADEIETNEIAFDVFQRWFADCWREAGGSQCKYMAYIQDHDSNYAVNLKTGEQTDVNSLYGFDPEPDPFPKIPWPSKDEITRRRSPRQYEDRVSDVFQKGDLEVLKKLIADGWDVNYAPYREDISSLEQAVMTNMIEVAEVLLVHGADMGVALFIAERSFAISSHNAAMIDLLKKYQQP